MKPIAIAVALCALLFSGCASYNLTSVGGRTTIDIQNTGWYLFRRIPLASGDPDSPNRNVCRIFTDTVKLENNMKMLRHAMIQNGAFKAENIVSHTTDEKVFVILLQRYICHTSAELIK